MAEDRKNHPEARDGETGSGDAKHEVRATEEKLEPGEGPLAPRGDALLDGSGTRHGVDERDERPGDEG